jgi:hypothetical protein
MKTNDNTDKVLIILKKILSGGKELNGWFTFPYGDKIIRYKVYYSFKKASIWKRKEEKLNCIYDGTIYVNVKNICLKFEDNFDCGYFKNDVPEFVWDDLEEEIVNEIGKILPFVCVDVDINFE